MKYIFTYVFSYIFECRYGDGLLARPSDRLEPQVLLCSCWAPSPRGATSSSTWGGDLYTPRLVWPVCNEILLFITYVFVGIPLFRQFCLLQVTWVRSTDSGPSCRGWAYSARPIPPDGARWQMEAGDTHVPPPVWGDDSYAAGRGLPPRPPYRRGGCRSACGGGLVEGWPGGPFCPGWPRGRSRSDQPAPASSRSFEDLVPTVYSTYSLHI